MKAGYPSKSRRQAIAHLLEEAGEVVAAGGKTLRFGLHAYNPDLPPEDREENIDWLLREVDDLEKAIATFRLLIARAR